MKRADRLPARRGNLSDGRSPGQAATGWVEVLLYTGSADDLARLMGACHARRLRPVTAMDINQAVRLIGEWEPNVAIVVDDDGSDVVPLLSALEERAIPTVLAAGPETLMAFPQLKALSTAVSPSGDAAELARVAEIVATDPSSRAREPIRCAGPLCVDLDEGVAFVEGRRVELPRIELAVLAELARQPGQPISSDELARRVWTGTATAQDVHRHVYRLRELLGDHERLPPLIINRRGFGYALNRRQSERRG